MAAKPGWIFPLSTERIRRGLLAHLSCLDTAEAIYSRHFALFLPSFLSFLGGRTWVGSAKDETLEALQTQRAKRSCSELYTVDDLSHCNKHLNAESRGASPQWKCKAFSSWPTTEAAIIARTKHFKSRFTRPVWAGSSTGITIKRGKSGKV